MLDEANVGNVATKIYICDETGNEYRYDTDHIFDTFVKKLPDGRSVIYFGFVTEESIPEEEKIDFGFDEDPF
jgi:hypothetical protein